VFRPTLKPKRKPEKTSNSVKIRSSLHFGPVRKGRNAFFPETHFFRRLDLAVLMLKIMKKQTNVEMLKQIYAKTMTQAILNDRYQEASNDNFIQAFQDLLDEVDEVQAGDGVSGADDMGLEDLLKEAAKKPISESVIVPNYESLFDSETNHAYGGVEEGVGDGAAAVDGTDTSDSKDEAVNGGDSTEKDKKITKLKEKIASLSAACPTNVKNPNFLRWGRISAVAKVIFKHCIPLVYMSQNIIDMEKKKGGSANPSYIQIVATKLLELMISKEADPSHDSTTHYTSLKWIVAFGDAFFDANMEWVKRHDPVFGARSYGHISRLVPEHLFVMHKQLE
jgi:hypothetical protein